MPKNQQNTLEELDSYLKKKKVDEGLPVFDLLKEIRDVLQVIADKELPPVPELQVPEVQKIEFVGGEMIKGDVGERGEKGDVGEMGSIGPSGRNGIDGKDGESVIGPQGVQGEKGEPGTIKDLSPEEIRNALELLLGEDRLKASAIDGLDTRLSEIDRKASRVMTPAKAYMVRKVDLSASCDGSTKTFSVGGSHFGIMGVFSTEFPIVYRPVIDYTETNTGFTLTSAVSAPASGQTLICQFLK